MVRRRSSRFLWLTRGPRAGRFTHADEAEAAAIINAGMGQDAAGLSDRHLTAAEVTDDPYPASVAGEGADRATPKKRKATYKRRDLRAED